MSAKIDTFIDLCLMGEVLAEEIDDFVAQWHETDTDRSIEEYLGLTPQEYILWVEKPEALEFILYSRRYNNPLQDYEAASRAFRVAARAVSPEDADTLIHWLRETGRIAD
jgi:hypothetical protein